MYKPQPKERTTPMFWELESMLDNHHELYVLANQIDWDVFEKTFAPLFKEGNGWLAKPIRLMTGPILLKHLRNVSDETMVDQFKESAYYQYFCREAVFTMAAPLAVVKKRGLSPSHLHNGNTFFCDRPRNIQRKTLFLPKIIQS